MIESSEPEIRRKLGSRELKGMNVLEHGEVEGAMMGRVARISSQDTEKSYGRGR